MDLAERLQVYQCCAARASTVFPAGHPLSSPLQNLKVSIAVFFIFLLFMVGGAFTAEGLCRGLK